MADKTKIEWTDATWTPIRARRHELLPDGSAKERIGWHCEHVSEGCRNCYAESLNRRLGTGRDFKPVHLVHTTRAGDKSGDVEMFLDEKMLLQPLRWTKGRNIFVCSMTDLFADFVPFEIIDKVFAVMAMAGQHTFQCLTKRSARMRLYMARFVAGYGPIEKHIIALGGNPMQALQTWPLTNVWLGVSVEDQSTAEERIADLLMTPAAIRYLSMEPLLGAIDVTALHNVQGLAEGQTYIDALRGIAWETHGSDYYDTCNIGAAIDWGIVGGESQPGARPMHVQWARVIRDAFAKAEKPLLFKQWGSWIDHDQPGVDMLGSAKSAMHQWPDGVSSVRLGKKLTGRLLDGIEHNGMPERQP